MSSPAVRRTMREVCCICDIATGVVVKVGLRGAEGPSTERGENETDETNRTVVVAKG